MANKELKRKEIDKVDFEKIKRHKETVESLLQEKTNNASRKSSFGLRAKNNDNKLKNKIVSVDHQKCIHLKTAINEKICDFEKNVVRPKGGLNNLSGEEREEYNRLWRLLKQFNNLKNQLNTKNKK